MPKGEFAHTALSERDWARRMKSNGNGPRNVRRFRTAGELALMAGIRPGSNLKQIHGTLQLLRHWWLSEDYDLVPRDTVRHRLKKLGVSMDLSLESRGDQEGVDASTYPIKGIRYKHISSSYRASNRRPVYDEPRD